MALQNTKGNKEGKITLVPYGGIARRLSTIASFVDLAIQFGRKLEIVWFATDRFQAPYDTLFQLKPYCQEQGITIRNASWYDWFFNDTPSRQNLFLPYPSLLMRYHRYISPKNFSDLVENRPLVLEQILSKHNEQQFVSTNLTYKLSRQMFDVFEPSFEVKSSLRSKMAHWGHPMIGIHINRQEGPGTQDEAPLDLFIKLIQGVLSDADSSVGFYVATIEKEERERLQVLFSNKVYTPNTVLESQFSKEGIIESYSDLLALSQTDKIYTTPNSRFADTAALIGHVPIEQLSIFSALSIIK